MFLLSPTLDKCIFDLSTTVSAWLFTFSQSLLTPSFYTFHSNNFQYKFRCINLSFITCLSHELRREPGKWRKTTETQMNLSMKNHSTCMPLRQVGRMTRYAAPSRLSEGESKSLPTINSLPTRVCQILLGV